MGLFDIIQAANAVDTIVSTLSEAAKVLGDKNATPEEKKDAASRETFEELQKQREDWKDVLSEVDDLLKKSENTED